MGFTHQNLIFSTGSQSYSGMFLVKKSLILLSYSLFFIEKNQGNFRNMLALKSFCISHFKDAESSVLPNNRYFVSILPVNSLLFLYGKNIISFLLHHFPLRISHIRNLQDLRSSTRRVWGSETDGDPLLIQVCLLNGSRIRFFWRFYTGPQFQKAPL
jgi:hypothetical protein